MTPLGQAAQALTRALIDDPFYLAISGQAEPPQRYFAYALEEAQRTGRCVLAADPADGAAAWLLPRSGEVEAAESWAKAVTLNEILGARGHAAYNQIVASMSALAARHVSADTWYLSIVGIDPRAQGRGLGTQLVAPTLAEASAAGVPCYVETFSRRSARFYELLGFVALASERAPIIGEEYVLLRRDP